MINSVLTRIIVVFSFLCCVIFGLQAGYQPEFSTAGFFSLPNTGRQAYSMNVAWRFFKGDIVGDAFEKGSIFLPQLLQSATATQAAFEVIKTAIAASGSQGESKGRIVIATVKGDVHDIGKNIVRVILENYGYDVLDLGRDVPPERVVEAVRQTGAKLVGLSALMTTTVPNMQATIEALHAAKLDCKVMVGGAVLTPSYAKDIGADYYCKDAKASADLAKQLLG